MDQAIRRLEGFYADGHGYREYLRQCQHEDMLEFSAKNEQFALDATNRMREVLQEEHENLETLLVKQFAEMGEGKHFFQLENARAKDKTIAILRLQLANARTEVDMLKEECRTPAVD